MIFTYEITHYFQNVKTDYILLPSTPLFREAAAEMAVRLSASLLTDCIALSVDNGRLQGLRPSLDGKSLSHYAFSASAPGKIVFVRKIIHENVSKDIKDAPLIFAGGRGLMNEQSFEALRRLADFFDASVGASRPVVDCGWAGPRANRPDRQFRSSQSVSGLRHLRSYPASGQHEKQSMYHCGKHQPEFANLSIL